MEFMNKKIFRVLTCIILSVIVSVAFLVIALKFNGTNVILSAFAGIVITILNILIYLLFDSDADSKSFIKTSSKGIFFFILMGVEVLICLVIVLLTAFANAGEITNNIWQIGLLYLPLAQTSISIFTFLFINEKRQWEWDDDCLVAYPFVNLASCAVGYLLMVAVSALGFAVDFLFHWADIILFFISLIAIVVFMKVNDVPFTYTSKKGNQMQKSNSSSSIQQTQDLQTYSGQPSRNSGGRDVFFKWLKRYCNDWQTVDYEYDFKVDKELSLYTWSNMIRITYNVKFVIKNKSFNSEHEMNTYASEVQSSIKRYYESNIVKEIKTINSTVQEKIVQLREEYTGLDEAWSVKVEPHVTQEVE